MAPVTAGTPLTFAPPKTGERRVGSGASAVAEPLPGVTPTATTASSRASGDASHHGDLRDTGDSLALGVVRLAAPYGFQSGEGEDIPIPGRLVRSG
jgi:hypothetical protein